MRRDYGAFELIPTGLPSDVVTADKMTTVERALRKSGQRHALHAFQRALDVRSLQVRAQDAEGGKLSRDRQLNN